MAGAVETPVFLQERHPLFTADSTIEVGHVRERNLLARFDVLDGSCVNEPAVVLDGHVGEAAVVPASERGSEHNPNGFDNRHSFVGFVWHAFLAEEAGILHGSGQTEHGHSQAEGKGKQDMRNWSVVHDCGTIDYGHEDREFKRFMRRSWILTNTVNFSWLAKKIIFM